MKLRHFSAFALIAVLAGGCSAGVEGTSHQGAAAASGTSVIYLYRPDNRLDNRLANEMLMPLSPKFGSPVALPLVKCGNGSIRLLPRSYHRFVVEPGQTQCSVNSGVISSVTLDAKAGETYYVEESITPGNQQFQTQLQLVSSGDAQPRIRICVEQ